MICGFALRADLFAGNKNRFNFEPNVKMKKLKDLNLMNIKDMKIGILGLARSGIAAAYKIKELGGNPFLSEFKSENEIADSEKIKRNFRCEFGGHSDKLFKNELIIVSPGIPLNIPIIQKLKDKKIKLISEIEFGFLLKNQASKIIAVTGSNGKSTTVSLIHHILQTLDFKAVLAGNIGKAFTSFPVEKKGIDFIVLELSSFQLDLIDTFRPDAAILLNITPDHLNRYADFEAYADAKYRIFQNQKSEDLAVLNLDDKNFSFKQNNIDARKKYFSLQTETDIYFDGEKIVFGGQKFELVDSPLTGFHNIANIMASVLALANFGIKPSNFFRALKTFSPLPHRLEFVAKIDGIKFINDSKATNTDAVKYALQSFSNPIRIILGGSDKGEDFSVLLPYLRKFAKKVYLIGETREKMKKTFAGKIKFSEFEDFQYCIETAFSEAEKNDVILLSPACASYDMFKNFEWRGDFFKQIVENLKR